LPSSAKKSKGIMHHFYADTSSASLVFRCDSITMATKISKTLCSTIVWFMITCKATWKFTLWVLFLKLYFRKQSAGRYTINWIFYPGFQDWKISWKRVMLYLPVLCRITNAYLSQSAFLQLSNAEVVLKLETHASSKNALGYVLILQ